MYFFISDEHFSHKNVLTYCDRPFNSIEEHDEELIRRHNEVVGKGDIVVHGGDFTLIKNLGRVEEYIERLNGSHIFIKGSHDYWLGKNPPIEILDMSINKQNIIICHYCMRTWPRSHYNSWHLYGHSHGTLEPIGKSWDIGVDNNNFFPVSFEQIELIMSTRPDNPNLIKK